MRYSTCSAALAALLISLVGCSQNGPFAAKQPNPALDQQMAQAREIQRRAAELDTNNQALHTQIAQSQQQVRLLEDQLALVQRQLNTTTTQLAESNRQKQDSEQRLQAFQASMQRRGGATIQPNNSLQAKMPTAAIEGVEIRRDGELIRIEISSDRLFVPGTATLHQGGVALLGQAADLIARNWPRENVAIEGHTDNEPVSAIQWRSAHQLSASQASMAFDVLTQSYRFDPTRLSVQGFGASRPLASNGTPQGKAKNRRLELVISPAQ